jgi:hypothetical protein
MSDVRVARSRSRRHVPGVVDRAGSIPDDDPGVLVVDVVNVRAPNLAPSSVVRRFLSSVRLYGWVTPPRCTHDRMPHRTPVASIASTAERGL